MLGIRLAAAGHPLVTAILAAVAAALWLVLTYAVPASLLVARSQASAVDAVNGTWLLWVVATLSLSVLAGARILGLPAALPIVRVVTGFVEGFSFALWAFGTWWVPLLIVLGVWRYARHHWPLAYEPALWSVVFPLGMYSVATLAFGQVANLAFMAPLSRFMLWVAVAAWVAVGAAFFAQLRRPT